MKEKDILRELSNIVTEAESIGPYLEGNLLKNKKAKYTCKDGTTSEYPTSPVLQYRVAKGKRKSKRIPEDMVPHVEKLLEAGRRHKSLMERHRELSAMIALDFKKNSGDRVSSP